MVRNDASNDRDENDHRGYTGEAEPLVNNGSDDIISNATETDVLIPSSGGEVGDGSAKKRATTRPAGPRAVPGGRRKVRTKSSNEESAQAVCIKYSALFLLVAQMVGLVLLMRYSRTVPRKENDPPLYLASTAVFVMEVMKLVICLGVVAYQTGLSGFVAELNHHILASPMEMIKLSVPSVLYTVQNNLLYLALTNLDAATYQVCYQLKILTTALFSALLLQRQFSATKWASLVVLTIGVAIVQLSGSGDQHSSSATHEDQQHRSDLERANLAASHTRWIGLMAVICAACTSGFSGVYFGRFYLVLMSGETYQLDESLPYLNIPLVVVRKNLERQSHILVDS